MTVRHPQRLPLLAIGIVALLAGLWAGLVRLGWDLPVIHSSLPLNHGPLMVSGFLGTLISLERAVALHRSWAYTAPIMSGLGALSLIAGLPGLIPPVLMAMGSLGLSAVFAVVLRRERALFTAVMGLGALCWVIGNLLWLAGWPISRTVPWWTGFLLLTIAGERLELARLLRLSTRSQAALLGAVGLLLSGFFLSLVSLSAGARLVGLGTVAVMLWLLGHDIARRTVRQPGLTRFIAVCLLSSYVWLGISGLLGLLVGGTTAGPEYDALLHSFFLGFVFAMIFGHAPLIFPAVLGAPMRFRPTFYAHLALLHLTLLLRVVGDLLGWWPGRQIGGLLNVFTLLLFLANTVSALLRSSDSPRASS